MATAPLILIKNLLQTLRFLIVVVAVLAAVSSGALLATEEEKGTIVFRWTDGEGKVHYAENFNSIPSEHKAIAVQGWFVVAGGNPAPVPEPLKPGEPEPEKETALSNRLDILEDIYFEENSYLHIQGKVRNGFSLPISFIKVKVTFYDKSDNFLRVESTYVDPIELQPGEEGTYTMLIRSNPNVGYYKTEFSWK